jgi:hypothetical protein
MFNTARSACLLALRQTHDRCRDKYDKNKQTFASEVIIIKSQNFYRENLRTPLVLNEIVLYRAVNLKRISPPVQ